MFYIPIYIHEYLYEYLYMYNYINTHSYYLSYDYIAALDRRLLMFTVNHRPSANENQTLSFFSGNPHVQTTHGTIHLYKQRLLGQIKLLM